MQNLVSWKLPKKCLISLFKGGGRGSRKVQKFPYVFISLLGGEGRGSKLIRTCIHLRFGLVLFFNGFFKLYKLETTSYFGLYCQAFSKSISYLQYHEIYILVSYLFKIVRTRPMHLTIFRVHIWGHFKSNIKSKKNPFPFLIANN